ncbi:MAG TPA: hypothetical protein VK176_11620 [Phycisphaerales bacterium]|nr:hypothetical protein [Phycisphaerales bacterium]
MSPPERIVFTTHAMLRAAERLDLVATQELADYCLARIGDGTFHAIGHYGESRMYWAVLNGIGCILVIRDNRIITVIPPGAIVLDDQTDTELRRVMAAKNGGCAAARKKRQVVDRMAKKEAVDDAA